MLVSGFLAPSTDAVFTFPDKLREEMEAVVGEYLIDVKNFRADDRDRILEEIHEMTDRRFKVFRHFIDHRPCDFMMMVEMGSDRIHHAFWRFTDPDHPKFEAGNPYEHAVKNYWLTPSTARGCARRDLGFMLLGRAHALEGRKASALVSA